jgi:Ca-activated chloride channel family protein
MRAKDVEPDRMTAAQNAAKTFINEQPRSTRVGIVAFAGTASLVQPPTNSREDLHAAIDRLQLQRATAIGSGILVALKAIFPDVDFDLRSTNPRMNAPSQRPGGFPGGPLAGGPRDADKAPPKPVPPGSYKSAAISCSPTGRRPPGPTRSRPRAWLPSAASEVYTVGVGARRTERSWSARAGRCGCGSTRRR